MSATGEPEKLDKADNISIGISRRYSLAKSLALAVGGVLLGFRVYGYERVPESEPLIIASNHRSYLDPVYVCMAVPRRIQWMGKKELFVFPVAWFFYLIGTFPVDRQGGGRGALRAALRYLKLGAALGIFPEGTRRKDDNPDDADGEPPKNGAVMLASRSGALVLPVHVGRVPNPLQRLRGERLEVHIAEPRTIQGNSSKSYGEIAEGLVREIYALPVSDTGGKT